jgi:hypothetical protein
MHDDLHARLLDAARGIEEGAAPFDDRSLSRVRATARRHRIQRRSAQSVVGVAAVAVVALALELGAPSWISPRPPLPGTSATSTPAPSATPSRTPDATPSPSPTGPPARAADPSVATVMTNLREPRTGEAWQTPVPAPEIDAGVEATAFRIGTRGQSTIYMTVSTSEEGEPEVLGLYEVDAAGTRLIACPSAREGDPCTPADAPVIEGATRDESTFYDSLTLPGAIPLAQTYALSTEHTRARGPHYGTQYGSLQLLGSDDDKDESILDLGGGLQLATVEWPSDVPTLTNRRYEIRTPFGTRAPIDSADVPGGDFSTIRWDDGLVPDRDADPALAMSPVAYPCEASTFATDAAFDPTQWKHAGTSSDGLPVQLPVDGGNATSRDVRLRYEPLSEADAESPFLSEEAFLAANALYAVQGGDGEWLLGLRTDIVSILGDCY